MEVVSMIILVGLGMAFVGFFIWNFEVDDSWNHR